MGFGRSVIVSSSCDRATVTAKRSATVRLSDERGVRASLVACLIEDEPQC